MRQSEGGRVRLDDDRGSEPGHDMNVVSVMSRGLTKFTTYPYPSGVTAGFDMTLHRVEHIRRAENATNRSKSIPVNVIG